MTLKNVISFFLGICLILSFGCARTVDQKDQLPELRLRLTFKGPVDVSRYRYFLVFSSTATPTLLSVPPSRYFPTPGRSYLEDNGEILQANGINAYYRSYFSTWSDYIVIGSGLTPVHFPSGGVQFSPETTSNNAYQSNLNFSSTLVNSPSNVIELRFLIQQLSPQTPGTLYFRIATVALEDGSQTGMLQDMLDDRTPSIVIRLGEKTFIQAHTSANPDVPDGANLLSWEAEIL